MNELVNFIQIQVDQYQQILDKGGHKPEFILYVQEKQNAQLLQKEQCMQQIEKVKIYVSGKNIYQG